MKQKVWIVSWYGTRAGGLERIVRITNQVLKSDYNVNIIDIPYICQYKGWKKLLQFKNRVVLMLVFSLFVKKVTRKGDIIITHGQNAPFVKSDFLFNHGSILSLKREMGEFIYGGSSIFEFLAVRKAKMNVAVSNWTQNQIMKNYHISSDKIIVLNNCVETDIFYPIKRKKNKRITILFCGRLETAKGIDLLLQLASNVEKSQKYELRIAANDERNAELFEGRAHISIECGLPIEEMNAFYNSGDVLFVPSKCEGFGMGIIESLAAGIPVVANEVGIMSDLIKDMCPAVVTMGKADGVEEVLQKISKISNEYQNYEKRLLIHSYIENNYGLSQYEEKLNELIKRGNYAQG